MSHSPDPTTALALRDLRYGYAFALDGRDADALRAVFHPDAVLRMFPPDAEEPVGETRGHEALATMVPAMAERYARTMHVITNPTSTVDGDAATGSAYCVAHHLIVGDGPPRTFVVHLRYDDEFRRGADGAWRISRRDIRFLWTAEGANPLPWETAVVRGRLG